MSIQIITVPVQLENYDEIFNEIDHRPMNTRKVNEEIDTLLKESLLNKNLKEIPQLQLDIFLPSCIKNPNKENLVQEGIRNYYDSFTTYERQIRRFGVIRITSYILSSLLLFILNYFLQSYYTQNFFSTLVDTSATVILWQASTMIFIDSKNFNLNVKINKLLSHLLVTYTYENRN